MPIYKILRGVKSLVYKRYNIPDAFGYPAIKNSQGKWVSSSASQPIVFIDNLEETVLQIDDALDGNDFKEFAKSLGEYHYIPAGKYIPCLLNEKIMLISKNFLQTIIS